MLLLLPVYLILELLIPERSMAKLSTFLDYVLSRNVWRAMELHTQHQTDAKLRRTKRREYRRRRRLKKRRG